MFCLLASLVHFKTDLLLSRVQREIPSFSNQVAFSLFLQRNVHLSLSHIVITFKKEFPQGHICTFFLSPSFPFYSFPEENNFVHWMHHSVWLVLTVCAEQLSSKVFLSLSPLPGSSWDAGFLSQGCPSVLSLLRVLVSPAVIILLVAILSFRRAYSGHLRSL